MNINFFTPITYSHSSSLKQKLTESVDRYFCLNGRVAEVITGISKSGNEKVILKKEKILYWQTALKVISYITLIIPLLMLIAKAILRSTLHVQIYPYRQEQGVKSEEEPQSQEVRELQQHEIKQEPESPEKRETTTSPANEVNFKNSKGEEIRLPKDMKKEILSFLEPKDLRNVTLLNKDFQIEAEDAKIAWLNKNKACISDLGLSFQATVNLLEKRKLGEKLEYLEVHDMSQALEFIKHCPNLKQLVIKSKDVRSKDLIELVSHHFSKLEELTIHRKSSQYDILKGLQAFSAASNQFPNLKSLSLKRIARFYNEMEVLAAFPILRNLKTLSIHKGEVYQREDRFIQVFLDIPFFYLETLDLNGYYINKKIMAQLAASTNFPNLKTLMLSNNHIDDPHVEQFAHSTNFNKLERIELYKNIDFFKYDRRPDGLEKLMDSSNFPHLTFIGVTLRDHLVNELKASPNLHKLHIEPFELKSLKKYKRIRALLKL